MTCAVEYLALKKLNSAIVSDCLNIIQSAALYSTVCYKLDLEYALKYVLLLWCVLRKTLTHWCSQPVPENRACKQLPQTQRC
jgi:hypothetical protein